MNNDDVDVTDSENDDAEEEEDALSGEDEEGGYEEEADEDDDDDEEGSNVSDQQSDQSSIGNEQELGNVMFDTENISTQPSFTSYSDTGSKGSMRNQSRDEGKTNEDKPDEYEYDTSDEEDIRNTTGNVPKKWLVILENVVIGFRDTKNIYLIGKQP